MNSPTKKQPAKLLKRCHKVILKQKETSSSFDFIPKIRDLNLFIR